jgi:hypothetical protein
MESKIQNFKDLKITGLIKCLLTKEFISKDTFKHPPLYPLPSREGRFLSPLSLEGRGQG